MNEEYPLVMIVSSDQARSERLNMIFEDRYNVMQIYSIDEFNTLYDIMYLKTRVVIFDIVFPEVDMGQLIKELWKKNVMTEYLIISDDTEFEKSVQLLSSGFRDNLLWSFSDELILGLVDDAVDHIDSVSRLKYFTHRFFFDAFGLEVNLDNVTQWAQRRRIQGRYITFNDLLESVSMGHKNKELFEEIITTKILPFSTSDKAPTILVVEDDLDAQENIKELISDDYRCLFSDSIDSARAYNNSDEHIDIVLLDMYLPGGMGISLISEFKAKNKLVEIIVVTAFKELQLASKALKMGASDYFNKPYNASKLSISISKAAQRLYFRKYLVLIEDHIIQYQIPYKIKLYLLSVLCERKRLEDKDIFMSDVYVFFPELEKLTMSPNLIVPRSSIDEGVMVFVEELNKQLVVG